MNKIISYIGFAQKSNNLIAGQTPLKRTKKQLYVILVCNTGSDNLKNLAKNLSVKHRCKWFITDQNLETLTNVKDIKIIGVTDENLANGIVNHFSN